MFGLIHYDMIDNMFGNTKNTFENSWLANSNVRRTDEGFEIDIDLPGLSRSDIDVEILSNTLRVSASREIRNSSSMYSFIPSPVNAAKNSETNKATYEKSWSLPDGTNYENISAKYEAGVLHLEVPVKRPSKRKISVE